MMKFMVIYLHTVLVVVGTRFSLRHSAKVVSATAKLQNEPTFITNFRFFEPDVYEFFHNTIRLEGLPDDLLNHTCKVLAGKLPCSLVFVIFFLLLYCSLTSPSGRGRFATRFVTYLYEHCKQAKPTHTKAKIFQDALSAYIGILTSSDSKISITSQLRRFIEPAGPITIPLSGRV